MKTRLEALNALDVLLLVLIKHGVTTTYELRSYAGIGGSMTVKQLQLLEEKGLLTSTSGNERLAKRYAITDLGETKLLEAMDREMQRPGRLGADSLMRSLFLEWLYPQQIDNKKVIQATSSALKLYHDEKVLEADRLRTFMDRLKERSPNGDYGSDVGQLVAYTFKWLRAKSEAAMLKAQLEAVPQLARISEVLPSPPHVQPYRTVEEHPVSNAVAVDTSRRRPAKLDAAGEPQLWHSHKKIYKKKPDYLGQSDPVSLNQQKRKGGGNVGRRPS
jgi:DNA-binding PadR family transcriptional regulator